MIDILEAFDFSLLSFYHTLAELAGGVVTPLMKFITLLGEKGILLLIIAVVLMLFAKTRKIGVCMFGAVCCGALVTDIILKDVICRVRPMDEMGSVYHQWWLFLGSPAEDGFSFPSGHATSVAAGFTALALIWKKGVLKAGIPCVLLMCAARNYLMAHYPTDVLAGCAVGVISAVIAYGITLAIFAVLEKYRDRKWANFLLTGVDAQKLFDRIGKKG